MRQRGPPPPRRARRARARAVSARVATFTAPRSAVANGALWNASRAPPRWGRAYAAARRAIAHALLRIPLPRVAAFTHAFVARVGGWWCRRRFCAFDGAPLPAARARTVRMRREEAARATRAQRRPRARPPLFAQRLKIFAAAGVGSVPPPRKFAITFARFVRCRTVRAAIRVNAHAFAAARCRARVKLRARARRRTTNSVNAHRYRANAASFSRCAHYAPAAATETF